MFAYHIVWNLGFFRLVARIILGNPNFHAFGHAVAAAFVGLAGVCIALAARDGLRLGSALRRADMIALATAAVSATTYLSIPESFIFFGILRLIALASLCALPFLFAPAWLVAIVAASSLGLPILVFAPVFDDPIWQWIGLGTIMPRTNAW